MPQQIGLSSAEAAKRLREGQGNNADIASSRSLWEIFQANFLNIANIVLVTIVVILLAVGKPGDAFFTGGVVFVNILVGTYQEFQAKRKLDRIALLTRPKVTVYRDGNPTEIDQAEVVIGDVIQFKAGDQAVVDGKMVANPNEPDASPRVDVDESALTGESDLIPKRPGDEILSGSFAVVGEGLFEAEKVGNDSFAQKITAGARQFTRNYTPLQREISIIVRVLVVLALVMSGLIALQYTYLELPFDDGVEDAAVVISLIPQGLLLMITVAYALGAVRIAQKGALVQQSNAVESLSNVDVLCMDKTGTLTTNRILFDALHPIGTGEADFRQTIGAYIASTSARNRTADAIAEAIEGEKTKPVAEIPFSSLRKWSAASFDSETLRGTFVLGASEMILPSIQNIDHASVQETINGFSEQGLRVLFFAESSAITQPDDIPQEAEPDLPPNLSPIGIITFTDELRPRVGDVLAGFREANITLKVISGDNPTTVAALAYQAGFDPDKDLAVSGVQLAEMSQAEFRQTALTHAIFGRITPDQKSALVDVLRENGHYVAMMGDGVNDVLSLKKAQVGIAMEDGSQATRAVADIVLLDNKFEILPDAFLEGQRILNGMNDSTRLFLTRTLYAAILIVIAGFIGSALPFTPRHNALLTTIPVGIPAFFLAYWAKSGQPEKKLIRSTLEFVIPASISLMLSLVFLWILYLTYDDASLETSRTVVTTASVLSAIWIIILAEHDRSAWRNAPLVLSGDPRRIGLAICMLILFIVIMLVPSFRDAFEMTSLSAADIATVLATVAVWFVSLQALWRFDILERLMIPNYGAMRAQQQTPES